MKSEAILQMIVTIISKVFGLLRQSVLSSLYATGDVASAFITSQTLPVLIVSFVATGIATGFIPTYNQIVSRHGKRAGDRFTSNVNNTVFVLMIIIMILCEIFAYPLVKLFAKGYTGYRLDLTVLFMRIALISLLPSIVAAVFRGYLNANNHFLVQNLQGFILNLVTVGALILSYTLKNTWILGIGLVLAISFQYILYIPVVKKYGFHYHPGIHLNDPYLKRLLLLAIPVTFGNAVTQINVIIDSRIASVVADNGVTVLAYASRLTEFVNGIVITTITTIVFPQLSRLVVNRDLKGLKNSILSSLSAILVLVLPSVTGLMIFAEPVVSLVYEHGHFSPEDTRVTAACLFMYAIGLMGTAVREIIAKTFYSLNDTKTPTVNSMIMVALNITGNLILSRFIGVKGLALATSIAAVTGSITLSIHLYRKLGSFEGMPHFIKELIKMLISTAIMGFGSWTVFHIFMRMLGNPEGGKAEALALMIAILSAVVLYLVSVLVLRVQEVHMLIEGFKNRRARKQKKM